MVQEEDRTPPAGSPNQAARAANQWDAASQPDIAAETTPPQSERKSQTGRAAREIIETLLLAALIFFLVRLVVLNFRVDGESMIPNLQDSQMLLVNVNSYRHFDLNNLIPGQGGQPERIVWPFGEPERGDIIVFNPTPDAEQPYIKRIIGLPGEHITFQDGYVYVNGERLSESYIDGPETECRRRDTCDIVVSEDHIFVLGDNRTNSTDSRSIGEVPLSNVIGKAWLSYWPLDLFGFVPHYDYGNSVGEGGIGAIGSPQAAVAAPTETKDERRSRRQATREARQEQRQAATPAPALVPST
jgi:signal peptidase I